MKYLLLMRHAKSSWKDLNIQDHDRSLNKRGKSSAPVMGYRLSQKPIQPQLIITSTAKRSLRTAQIVAQKINHRKNDILTTKNLYHASPETMINIISQSDTSIDSLMLVGHNPGITSLSNHLLNKNQFDNIPTAGLVTFSLEINNWKDLLQPLLQAKLLDYDYPKLTNSYTDNP